MSMFMGVPVIVSRPTSHTARRTWRDRLWSRPWRPWRATKIVIRPAPIAPDQIFRVGNQLYMDERAYEQLKHQFAKDGDAHG